VLLFVFYLFTPPPLLFNRVGEARVRASGAAPEFEVLQQRFAEGSASRAAAASTLIEARRRGGEAATTQAAEAFRDADSSLTAIRQEAGALVSRVTGERYNDVNYVFPTFLISSMPVGLVGIVLAAIFAAAMSTIASELNALSTATVIDFYRRFFRTEGSDQHYLRVSKVATGFWGVFACMVAIWAAEIGSLIEVVNRFGSFFYGSILGVFLLAILWKRASGHAAFVALLAGMATVGAVATYTNVAFLWLNVVGAGSVLGVGILLSVWIPARSRGELA
jgi:uncharacterized sodium:solute symporter family permease YidK